MRYILSVCIGVLFLNGCVVLESGQETVKTIWGSSTRALENERVHAQVKTYSFSYWEVFKAAKRVIEQQGYVLFKSDDIRGVMIVMGVPQTVNTTEIGIFFVEEGERQTRIEVTSLSTNAKRLLSKTLFEGLDIAFGLAQPKPIAPTANP